MRNSKFTITLLLLFIFLMPSRASNGYELWLKYRKVSNKTLLINYKNNIQAVIFKGNSETLNLAQDELSKGLKGLLGVSYKMLQQPGELPSLIVAGHKDLSREILKQVENDIVRLGKSGYLIKSIHSGGTKHLLITANSDAGMLYGVFGFLRLLQTHRPIQNLNIIEIPKTDLRILNHWDNLDRTVERGYAGESIWNWHKLPGYIDPRYRDYARANASVGINGTVLTNVNANALVLTPMYLEKVKALAEVFRPYGIKVYLTARFSAPIEIGGLDTADPLDPQVQQWWKDKVSEIYRLIPDFGGFLVKANSEGQPGPQNYGRNHLQGTKLLADALKPFKGIVMWRAFVYSETDTTDRAKQAYTEFVPFDGKFEDNVLIQVKNGPIDFQPREPFHPIFGAMPQTPVMIEFQITQEYLGFSSHLVFLPKLFEEVLQADTYAHGKGSPVSSIVDGSLDDKKLSGIAGVANIGSDFNWTGHPFLQANWYGFGRLAWNPDLSAEKIADDWIRSTFSNQVEFVAPVKEMMIKSREAVVNYMTPLGLHHIFNTGHHYGPGPWVSNLSRPEWNPVYYHKADAEGIGFDRTAEGSDALEQYAPEIEAMYSDLNTCPEEFLLWFHHVPWDYSLKNGQKLWDGMGLKYQEGVDSVRKMIQTWNKMEEYVDHDIYEEVSMLLQIQLNEAIWWKDACMSYFQQYSKMPFPEGMENPLHTLDYYESLKFPFAPGIKPQWD